MKLLNWRLPDSLEASFGAVTFGAIFSNAGNLLLAAVISVGGQFLLKFLEVKYLKKDKPPT